MKRAALLLAPGASATRGQPALVAIDSAASTLGITVERMDFPYTRAGRRAPDRAPVLIEALRHEAEALAARSSLDSADLFFGGRSMGGRIASMAVAEGLASRGLVLVSYPLHPPGRPERLRTEHFGSIDVPCLFVSGTRDAFGTPDELIRHTAAIPGDVRHVWIEGGDHSLRRKDAIVAGRVCDWLKEVLGGC